MKTAAAQQDVATKQLSEASYYQRLQEERELKRTVQAALITERKEKRELQDLLEETKTKQERLTKEYEEYKMKFAAELEKEKEAARAQNEVLVAQMKLENEKKLNEVIARYKRAEELKTSEERRAIEEEAAARVAKSYQEQAAELKLQYDSNLKIKDSQLEKLSTQLSLLLEWKGRAEEELRKATEERRMLRVRLQMTSSGFAHLKDYRCILKYMVVSSYVHRRITAKLLYSVHDQFISTVRLCAEWDSEEERREGKNPLIVNHERGNSIILGSKKRNALFNDQSESLAWLETSEKLIRERTICPDLATIRVLIDHIKEADSVITTALKHRKDREMLWKETSSRMADRNTEMTKQARGCEELKNNALAQLKLVQADYAESLNEQARLSEEIESLRFDFANKSPGIDKSILRKLRDSDQNIRNLRDALSISERKRKECEEQLESLIEQAAGKGDLYARLWSNRELERGWNNELDGAKRKTWLSIIERKVHMDSEREMERVWEEKVRMAKLKSNNPAEYAQLTRRWTPRATQDDTAISTASSSSSSEHTIPELLSPPMVNRTRTITRNTNTSPSNRTSHRSLPNPFHLNPINDSFATRGPQTTKSTAEPKSPYDTAFPFAEKNKKKGKLKSAPISNANNSILIEEFLNFN